MTEPIRILYVDDNPHDRELVRDAVFWGPLALNDPALGWECYQWFAESPLESGQIRTAIPLYPGEEASLTPQDDEGSLLFVMASDWLARAGYSPDAQTIERAYAWVQTHVQNERQPDLPRHSGPVGFGRDRIDHPLQCRLVERCQKRLTEARQYHNLRKRGCIIDTQRLPKAKLELHARIFGGQQPADKHKRANLFRMMGGNVDCHRGTE